MVTATYLLPLFATKILVLLKVCKSLAGNQWRNQRGGRRANLQAKWKKTVSTYLICRF